MQRTRPPRFGSDRSYDEFLIAPLAHVCALGRWLLHSKHGVAAIAQTIATKILLAGISVGTGILTARTLNAGGRGEQSAMLLWPALLCYLLTLGFPTAIRYCIRKEPERRGEFFTVSMLVALALSGVAFMVGLAFIPIWLHAYSPSVVHSAQILMIFAPEVMLGLILVAMFETIGYFSTANSMRYVPALATLLLIAGLAILHEMTPFRSALAYLAPPVITGVWMTWALREHIVPRLFDPRPALKTLSSYGIRAYGIDILGALSAQVDQVLVIGFLSASEMGIYAVALAASRVLQILHTAVGTVLFPTASGIERERIVPMVGRATRVSGVIALIFAAMLIIAFPILIPFMYGSEFIEATHVAQVLTLEGLIGGTALVLSQAFMALGRPGLVTVLQGGGLAIAVPMMFLFLPRFGLIGAAMALVISTSARFVFILISFPLILRLPIPNLLPTLDDMAALLGALPRRAA
jgi:O-antigen/teichoic acid export membrane protein